MGSNDDPRKMTGPQPTAFLGAGPGAEKILTEFSRMAGGMTLPLRGPFGLVLADSRGESLFTCDWPCSSDFRVLDPARVREQAEFVGPDEERLAALLSSLVRRLRAAEPGVDPAPGGRVRMSSYVVTDLSDPATMAVGVRLMRALHQVDTATDTTVLALTGRTATTDAGGEGGWFATCKLLLEQLQDGLLAHRVYLLDGCDSDKTWLERPEQLHRLGAEFLFYHGLACRGLFHPKERARTGAGESLLNVCGSFGCRTIPVDLSVVAERMAERVAREDLCEQYRRTVPSAWLEGLQEQARALAERIGVICERAGEVRTFPGSPARSFSFEAAAPRAQQDGAEVRRSENAEIIEAVGRTVRQVCAREPVLSLCLFFQLLQPKLARLLNQQRLWERARVHQSAAEMFRRQEEATYGPMRIWLARPQTQWADRFTPVQQEVSEVAVSRPATMKSYLTGGLVLLIGLVGVALGVLAHSRLLAATGGLVSLAGTVLMTLPVGWAWYPRNRLWERPPQEGEGLAGAAAETRGVRSVQDLPQVPYRQGTGGRIRPAWAVVISVGLLGVTWPLWPSAWTAATGLWAAIAVALAAASLAGLVAGPGETRPDEVSLEEAPDHVGPPVRHYRAAGFVGLALAWAVLCLGVSTPGSHAVGSWLAHLSGLALVAVGAGLALLPRTGYTQLIDHVDRLPQAVLGGIAHPVKERELPRGVTALAAWVDGLALDPDQCLERLRAADTRSSRETLLDFLAADWESQLVPLFRRAIETRSGKPFAALILQPALWADCITSRLRDPQPGGELTSIFALQAIKAWIESHPLPELLSFLNIDLARFGGLLARMAPAHWPTPRADPDLCASVVAVGRPLWEVVAPRTVEEGGTDSNGEGRPGRSSGLVSLAACCPGAAIVPLNWDSQEDKVVVLRLVQGLPQGWRGFPGLPGQPHANRDPNRDAARLGPESRRDESWPGTREPSRTMPVRS